MALDPALLEAHLRPFVDLELFGFDHDTFNACLDVRRVACRGNESAWEFVHALTLAAPDVYTRGTIAGELLEPFVRLSALPDLATRLQAAALADQRFRHALQCVWGLPVEVETWLAKLPPSPAQEPLLRDLYPELIEPLRAYVATVERLRVHDEVEAPGHRVIHTVPKRARPWSDARPLHLGAGDSVFAINVCGEIVISIEIAL